MGLRVDERIVAGGDTDELLVHHLVLRGSNRAIGRHLGELVRARYGARLEGPTPVERFRSTAAFTPPGHAASGHPLVTRTFEVAGPLRRARVGVPPSAGRPYVLELHPDEGHPSLAVCAFELEGAALDGVNAEGLVAVAVPDLASPRGADLRSLQLVRHLLDRCATAVEARAALADPGLDVSGAARWLVADRRGDGFLLEQDGGRRQVRRVDAAGEPLELATELDDAPLRTLWHGEYDALERRLAARFFVGAGDWRRGEAPELRFRLS